MPIKLGRDLHIATQQLNLHRYNRLSYPDKRKDT